MSLDLSSMRIGALEQYSENGFTSYSTFSGSAVVGSDGVHLDYRSISGSGGIVVRSFNDENGNGEWDGGEAELDKVAASISMGNTARRSLDGTFYMLQPNADVVVQIDRSALLDYGLFPRSTIYHVFVQGGTTHMVDVPFSSGYDVGGKCTFVDAKGNVVATSALNGLRIRLKAVEGNGEYEGEVFDDGTLLASGVSAGSYTIHFDESQMSYRRIRLKEPPAVVTIDSEHTEIPALTFERSDTFKPGMGP